MKKIILIHGWGGYPDNNWFPWLKKELEKRNWKVIVPAMPDAKKPEINSWINKIKEVSESIDEDTYFAGHSVGCQAILRYLQTIDAKIKIGGGVFVAPWMALDEETIKEGEDVKALAKPWIETPIKWDKIKSHTNNFLAIFSDNDPFVPVEENKKLFEEKLGAKTIIEKNKGHFDDAADIKKLPVLLEALLVMSKWK